MRLAPRTEYERSSMPGGLRSLKKQENTSFSSSSLTDMTDVKKKKRPFSLSVEQYLPIPRIQLSPLGGAKNKVPLKKVSSAPGSASRNAKSTKTRLNTVEMDTFTLTLGDGSEIGSSSTDDLSPLWQPEASPRLPSKLQSRGYNRMEEHEEEGGSMPSLNSSGSSAVFSLGSPGPGSATDPEISPISHSTPKVMPTGNETQRESKNGSETFYQTFLEGDFDSNPLRSSASGILRPKLNAHFNTSVLSQAGSSKGHNKNQTNRDSGLSEVSSTISVDSGASRFSYSDLPAITVNLVNEADEITEL